MEGGLEFSNTMVVPDKVMVTDWVVHMSSPAISFSDWAVPTLTPFLYLGVVYALHRAMQQRKAFEIKWFCVIHSAFLCMFSVVMSAGLIYSAMEKAVEEGGFALFCDCAGTSQKGSLSFWIHVYWVSKFPELIDTVILILKKKPLSFLHVFHHAIMLLLPWLWLNGWTQPVWFGCMLNSTIHVFMYFYYAGAAGWGYSPSWKKYLTSAQISQFVLVMIVTVVFFGARFSGYSCAADGRVIVVTQVVNAVFLYLFVDFYLSAYTNRSKSIARARKQD